MAAPQWRGLSVPQTHPLAPTHAVARRCAAKPEGPSHACARMDTGARRPIRASPPRRSAVLNPVRVAWPALAVLPAGLMDGIGRCLRQGAGSDSLTDSDWQHLATPKAGGTWQIPPPWGDRVMEALRRGFQSGGPDGPGLPPPWL